MKRNIFEKLKRWKSDERRKPLIIMGARQVGKTYILKKFAQSEYENYVYLNFENNPGLKSIFEINLNPQELLKLITIETGIEIKPFKTFIILDEAQECPNAINALKYFYEQANDYQICAAGSLLGVKLAHTKGFPVGKVNFLTLYPLCFSEFLNALGEDQLKTYLENIDKIVPLPLSMHDRLLQLFKTYLFTGGMPEAVHEYIISQNFSQVREAQLEILKAYSLDFAKHAPPDITMKITQIWDSIPGQLGKENKKFIYSVIRKGARAKDFETAIQWLYEAGLIHKVYNITVPKIPLNAYQEFDFFKLYLLDVGLLGAMTKLSSKILIEGHQLFQEFRGSFLENYVAQTLAQLNFSLNYWTSEGKAELDFIIDNESTIIPVEVKSGNSGKKRSLQVYGEKYNPSLMIRCSPMNLKQDGIILNCPIYLLDKIKQMLDIINET